MEEINQPTDEVNSKKYLDSENKVNENSIKISIINPIINPIINLIKVLSEPSKALMEKLENEGMNNLENLMKTGKQFDVDKLLNIMSDGANKFEQQTGRNLTYSELRELYG